MMKTLTISLAALAAASVPATANAATVLEGDVITCSTDSPGFSGCQGSNISAANNISTITASTGGFAFFSIGASPNGGSVNPIINATFENGILTLQGLGDIARNFTGTTLSFASSRPFTAATVVGGTVTPTASVTNGVLNILLTGTSWNSASNSTIEVSAVPEPGTWMLMIFGLGAVGFAMRRRQTAAVRYQFA